MVKSLLIAWGMLAFTILCATMGHTLALAVAASGRPAYWRRVVYTVGTVYLLLVAVAALLLHVNVALCITTSLIFIRLGTPSWLSGRDAVLVWLKRRRKRGGKPLAGLWTLVDDGPPAELEAAERPEGRGTEPEAAQDMEPGVAARHPRGRRVR